MRFYTKAFSYPQWLDGMTSKKAYSRSIMPDVCRTIGMKDKRTFNGDPLKQHETAFFFLTRRALLLLLFAIWIASDSAARDADPAVDLMRYLNGCKGA